MTVLTVFHMFEKVQEMWKIHNEINELGITKLGDIAIEILQSETESRKWLENIKII